MSKSFKEATATNSTTVLVVDALNLCFRWKHQGRTDFRFDFIDTVKSLANSYKCGRIIITAEWGKSSYRKNLAETYKADRAEKFKNQTEAEMFQV
jgi:hypothetical protein